MDGAARVSQSLSSSSAHRSTYCPGDAGALIGGAEVIGANVRLIQRILGAFRQPRHERAVRVRVEPAKLPRQQKYGLIGRLLVGVGLFGDRGSRLRHVDSVHEFPLGSQQVL
jgi:hypothetical protein